MLTPDDFDAFFAAVNGGKKPFAWQQRLLAELSEGRGWPDRIVAPTGSGKSTVVDVHIFAVSLFAAGSIGPVPRRLSVVVNRRALVDRHAERARDIAEILAKADSGVTADVASALTSLRQIPRAWAIDIVNMRGGLEPDRSWIDDPCACQIICATPDMWGSRVVFRGYGIGRLARPRDAGLLTHDAVMVLDEAHLNLQLLATARRIAEFVAPEAERIGIPGLHVVETTATPANSTSRELRAVDVSGVDLTTDDVLRDRLTIAKPVQLLPVPQWPPQRDADHRRCVDILVEQVTRLHTTYGRASSNGRTVACFVNTIRLATEVAKTLKDNGLVVEVVVGRMRAYDRRALPKGLLTTDGNDIVDVAVATQTLEVGVDADFAAAVSELAPAQALAQRAGRVNRIGRLTSTEFTVIGPDADSDLLTASTGRESRRLVVPPYADRGETEQYDHLRETWEWLAHKESDAAGLSPWALTTKPPPPEPPVRTLIQRLEHYDAWLLSRTNGELLSEPDLALWLRDSLEKEKPSAGLVVRSQLPRQTVYATSLLCATPPLADEIYPTDIAVLRTLLRPILERNRAWVYRNADLQNLQDSDDIGPGDIVIVDSTEQVCTCGVVVGSPHDTGSDVYDDLDGARWRFTATENGRTWEDRMLDDIADITRENDDPFGCPVESGVIDVLLRYQSRSQPLRKALAVPTDRLVLETDGLDTPSSRWLVISEISPVAVDDEARQLYTPARRVLLGEHNAAVAERAEHLGERLGLSTRLLPVLAEAGRQHDIGKRDPRFQRVRLRNNNPENTLLAKSYLSPRSARLAEYAGGLPLGWRHEQLSAAIAYASLTEGADRDLVLRLVGTSHGHGRPEFPHGAADLIDTDTKTGTHARQLFDGGFWDQLIETTHRSWGVWGCAYLEALLRAADCQISAEGR
ncbi:type I-U CRISPR-associated helicase/endonuclease Cas3 [Nocardia sp. BMG51109]|uniref:type I-G CRISPR-associated helicase/endonuclease Cas3g n=1 Tax=Nocardia sp. BMG51109 TaxID=1056816 RepID=UPI0004B7E3A7|nr:type I-U CRISPR-associated helicase/endonuclease Cas3 [Nocardia sp. BMG51109]